MCSHYNTVASADKKQPTLSEVCAASEKERTSEIVKLEHNISLNKTALDELVRIDAAFLTPQQRIGIAERTKSLKIW